MWMLFVRELRGRWVELLLLTVAVAVVVAGLVAQRAVTSSADEAVHDLAHRLGNNVLVLPASVDLEAFHAGRYPAEGLADSSPATILASPLAPHVRAVEARLYGNVEANGVPLVVVGQELGWPPHGGRVPAVLGGAAARALGAGPGGRFALLGAEIEVLQVADAPPDGLDRAVFLPLAAAQRLLGRPGEISALRLGGCWCRVDVAALASDVERLLPGTRALTVAGMLAAQKGSVATMKRYAGLLDAAGALLVAALVAALVGSAVRRRRREIGLLAAIGAPPVAVSRLFTWQAVAAGVAGGLAGWALAIPASRWLGAAVLGAPAEVPAGLLGPAVALSALASFVAAAFFARGAARLDPTTVLRES